MLFFQLENTNLPISLKKSNLKEVQITPHDTKMYGTLNISGYVANYDARFLYLRINSGHDEIRQLSLKSIPVDVSFCFNQSTYAIQHAVIRFFVDHELFGILIKNPKYDIADDAVTNVDEDQFNFRCSSVETLNVEQKSAIISILTNKHEIPFLLFGPPGK